MSRSSRMTSFGASPGAAAGRRRRRARGRHAFTAISASGCTSASMTRSVDFCFSWLRSRRTVSRFVSTSSLPPAMNPAT